jgi:acyl dehydratase
MVFVVVRFTLTNQRGERVATVDNRLMYRVSP